MKLQKLIIKTNCNFKFNIVSKNITGKLFMSWLDIKMLGKWQSDQYFYSYFTDLIGGGGGNSFCLSPVMWGMGEPRPWELDDNLESKAGLDIAFELLLLQCGLPHAVRCCLVPHPSHFLLCSYAYTLVTQKFSFHTFLYPTLLFKHFLSTLSFASHLISISFSIFYIFISVSVSNHYLYFYLWDPYTI